MQRGLDFAVALGINFFILPAIFLDYANAENADIYLIKEYTYISSHPSGGPTRILRRQVIGTPDNPMPNAPARYIRAYYGGGGRFQQTWEQELVVQEIKGYEVIYIPEQKLVNDMVFPGNYWCLFPERHLFRKFRFGKCTKEGFQFSNPEN